MVSLTIKNRLKSHKRSAYARFNLSEFFFLYFYCVSIANGVLGKQNDFCVYFRLNLNFFFYCIRSTSFSLKQVEATTTARYFSSRDRRNSGFLGNKPISTVDRKISLKPKVCGVSQHVFFVVRFRFNGFDGENGTEKRWKKHAKHRKGYWIK